MRRTTQVEHYPDHRAARALNEALLNNELGFHVWRPPHQVKRFGRPRRSSYRPVLTPLAMLVRDLRRLSARGLRWMADGLDGRR
jgi:hypothetical protein